MVQRDGAGLHVGAHAHAFGAADQDGDAAVAAGGEQFAFLAVVACFVDEADLLAGYAEGGELLAELVIDAPGAGAGGAEVGEDDLQRTGGGVRVAVRPGVHAVAVLFPDAGDGGRGDVDLLGFVGAAADQPQVECGGSPVAGDLEHVVEGGVDRLGPDHFRAFGQFVDVLLELLAGRHDDGLG